MLTLWNLSDLVSKAVFVKAASLLHPVSLQHCFLPLPNANWKTAMDLWWEFNTLFIVTLHINRERNTVTTTEPWHSAGPSHQPDLSAAPPGKADTGLVQPQGLSSGWDEASWGEGSLKTDASPALPSDPVCSPLRQALSWHRSVHSYPGQGPMAVPGDGQPWSLFLTHPGLSHRGCG